MFNIKDYGATGNGSTDDHAAISTAIDAAVQSTASKVVYFPPGKYAISRPVAVNAPMVELVGSAWNQSVLYTSFGGGPALLIASPRVPLNTQDSLVPGPGKAMTLSKGDRLFATDMPTMNLDGLTEFTVECFARTSALPQGPNALVSSMGRLANSDDVDANIGFELFLTSTASSQVSSPGRAES